MSAEDLEQYEADIELQLYKEYKDLTPMFSYVVETDRRSYLANQVRQTVRNEGGRTYIELELHDAWVWDMYRTSRFVQSVRSVTVQGGTVEERPCEARAPPRGGCRWAGATHAARTGSAWGRVVRSGRRTGTAPPATTWSPATGAAPRGRSTWSSGGPASWCSAR